MSTKTFSISKLATVITSGLALVLIVGCSDTTGLERRYSVTGTVKYKGEPVEKGRVDFIPVEGSKGRAASGDIEQGSYSLTTATTGDGAIPGSYKVTVTSMEVDTTKLKEEAKGGQFRHGPEIAKANAAAKRLVPSKYSLPDTSGLKAEVKAESNKFDFNLED
jgi:hypothetical protein